MKRIKTLYLITLSIGGLLLMLWYILPSVYISYTYMPVAVCSVVFCVLTSLNDRNRILQVITIYAPCLMLSVLYLIIPYNLQLKPAINIFQQMVIFTTPVILLMFISGLDKSEKINRRIYQISVLFVIVCIALVYIQTVRALADNPTVCRLLAVGTYSEYRADEVFALRMKNVGGFGFSYAIGIIEVFTFYFIFNEKKEKRIFFIIITAALILYIIKSQYLTLLLLCVIINLIIVFRYTKSSFVRILLALFIVIMIIFSGSIVNYLSQLITGEKLSEKMTAISGLLAGDGYSSMRLEYVRDAMKGIGHHFILGYPDLISSQEMNSVSSHLHTTQIKLLYDTGIIGLLIYNFYLFYLRSFVGSIIKKNGYDPMPFNMTFWFFWILSWLNPVFAIFEISFALFLVVPLLCYISKPKNRLRPVEQENILIEKEL